MESRIRALLHMKFEPVAIIWGEHKPEGAAQFRAGRWACVMWQFAAAAKGRTAVFDRETYGCWGGGVGLGFGNQYVKFPGGEDCFYYFLSTGNKEWEKGKTVGEGLRPYVGEDFLDDFLEGERYVKTPEQVRRFVEQLPIVDIPFRYVIFKPLREADPEKEEIKVVVFPVTSHQLAALVILSNYGKDTFENVVIPWAAGCQSIGIFTYREMGQMPQRGVVGMTDISARKNVRKQLGDDMWTFSVPFQMFMEMEENAHKGFLERPTWLSLRGK